MSYQSLVRERNSKIKELNTLVQVIAELRNKSITAGPIEAAKIEVEIKNLEDEERTLRAELDELDKRLADSKPEPDIPDIEPDQPPEPERPPDVTGFVGRATELAFFSGVLARAHFAVITGMPGVGKSLLAAKLAQQTTGDPARVFWHRFHEGEGVEAVIWKLAGMLARNGQDGLWVLLTRAPGSGGRTPPVEVLLDYLFQLVRDQGYIICLDDFQHVDTDPLVGKLIDRLAELMHGGAATLIITSRRMPGFVKSERFPPVRGFSREDAEGMLAARGVSVSESIFGMVYDQTAGNAELLNLAIDALQHTASPERLVAQLVAAQNVENYLKLEVYKRLKKAEKVVMSAVAVLQSGTRAAIEALSGIKGTQDVLDELRDRYLLNEERIAEDKVYSQHAMVQSYYYERLGQIDRQPMHARAAVYYETKEPDALRAAQHYQQAGEIERSAQLAASRSIVDASINGGRLGTLDHLLKQYQKDQLQAQTWALVLLTLARVAQWYGEDEARSYCQKALAALHALPETSDVRTSMGGAYRLMAQLIWRQDQEEAKTYLQGSLDLLPEEEIHERAATYIILSTILIEQGDLEAAEPAVRAGLDLLPSLASYERIEALQNLGAIFSNQGKLAESIGVNEQALAMCQKLGDLKRMSEIRANMGMDKFASGDWQGGVVDLQQALKLAQDVGSKRQQAGIHVNLVWMYFEMGEEATAFDHLEKGLTLARRGGFSEFIVTGLINGTYLYLRKGDLASTVKALDEAESIATMSARQQLPEIQILRDQVKQMQEMQNQATAVGQEA